MTKDQQVALNSYFPHTQWHINIPELLQGGIRDVNSLLGGLVSGRTINQEADINFGGLTPGGVRSAVASGLSTLATSRPMNQEANINFGGLTQTPAQKLAPAALAGARTALNTLGAGQLNQEGNISTGGVTAAGVGRALRRDLIDIPIVAWHHPRVIPETVKGAAELAEGSLPALAGLAGTLALHPLHAPETIAKTFEAFSKDIATRYGGSEKTFMARIEKEGAAPELLDLLGLAGGADATLGRAVVAAGRRFTSADTLNALTGDANFLTRARPALRISGNETRAQSLADTLGRLTLQRLEDRLRAIVGSSALHLRPGEVAPLF